MLGEILSKPFTFLLVGCLIIATAFCSVAVTRLAGNYQERARCMQLANALVSYGQKNNGFSNSTIYTSKTTQGTKNIENIINDTVNVFGFSGNVKPDIKIYKGKPAEGGNKVDNFNTLYPSGSTSSRLNRGDSFTVEITPKYYKIISGDIKDGKPIKAVGKAHGYIKQKE